MPHEVIPHDAGQPNVLYALVRKRAEIAGQIEHNQLSLRQLATDLAHIDAAINIFNPDVVIGAIRSKLPRHNPLFEGQVTRIVFDIMRNASKPISTREIAVLLMAKRGLDSDNRSLMDLMIKRVRACLSRQKKRGCLQSVSSSASLKGMWEVVR